MPERFRPLRELLLARARQFYREPETIFWVYFFPLLLMVGLGLAFRGQGGIAPRVRIAGGDEGRRAEVARALRSAPGLEVIEDAVSASRPADPTVTNELEVEVRGDEVVFRYDPERAESVLARERAERVLRAAAATDGSTALRAEEVVAPGSRYVDWLLPGLIGLNIMGGGLYGVGFVAVDLRLRKLLKRLRATPMRRTHFLLSLIGGRLLFLVPEMSVLLVVGSLAFGVEVRGSLFAVFTVGFVGAAAFAGLGLLVASRAAKLETISGLMNLIIFATERYPDLMQPFVQALPLTQLTHALRGVILEGSSLASEAPSLAALAAWGIISFPLALRLFRWQ
jgi:hypothetical protein